MRILIGLFLVLVIAMCLMLTKPWKPDSQWRLPLAEKTVTSSQLTSQSALPGITNDGSLPKAATIKSAWPLKMPDGRLINQYDDFCLDDPASVSNYYAAKGECPQGYSIVCDRAGNYCVKLPMGKIMDFDSEEIRTSRWEAVMTAWRLQGVLKTIPADFPEHATNVWQNCTCPDDTSVTNLTNSFTNYSNWRNVPTNAFMVVTNGMIYHGMLYSNPTPVTNGFERTIYGVKVHGYEVHDDLLYEDFATQLDLSVFPGQIILGTNVVLKK